MKESSNLTDGDLASDPHFTGDQIQAKLQKAIKKLPPKQRAVFNLKYFEELKYEDFNFDPVICTGIKECKAALTLARSGKLKGNFIEGMVCEGGCINGNGTLVNKKNVNSHIEDYMFSSSKHKLYKG